MRREPRMQAAAMLMATGLLAIVPALLQGGPSHPTAVLVEDFETVSSLPTVWVVNIPNENASVKLSTDRPHDGKQCLKLHYHFLATGSSSTSASPTRSRSRQRPRLCLLAHGRQLEVFVRRAGERRQRRDAPVQQEHRPGRAHRFLAAGRRSSSTWTPAMRRGAETRTARSIIPITAITLTVGQPTEERRYAARRERPLLRFPQRRLREERRRDPGLPDCRGLAGVLLRRQGRHPRHPAAPGFKSVTVKCWKQGGGLRLRFHGRHGRPRCERQRLVRLPGRCLSARPVTVRISGENGAVKDNCYLQLYNKGGVSWNEGMPKDPPPAAKACRWFLPTISTGPLSISSTDPKATYYDHKPPGRLAGLQRPYASPAMIRPGTRLPRSIPICGSGPATRRTVRA